MINEQLIADVSVVGCILSITSHKCRPPGELFLNGRSSQPMYHVESQTDFFLCQFIKRYLFSVPFSAFCLI